jgi:hypothetical protein
MKSDNRFEIGKSLFFACWAALCCLLPVWAAGQNLIPPAQQREIDLLREQGVALPTFAPFALRDKPVSAGAAALERWVALELNTGVLKQLRQQQPQAFRLAIPKGDGDSTVLLLRQIQLFTPDFVVRTSDGTLADYIPGLHYQGVADGQPTSVVSLNLFENEIKRCVCPCRR